MQESPLKVSGVQSINSSIHWGAVMVGPEGTFILFFKDNAFKVVTQFSENI